jgi:UDP-N-acetylglucosamine 2-epimerase (non-hydrolysing)
MRVICAAVLGIGCLTLRDNTTQRPVTITEGTNRPVRRVPDRIVRAGREVLAVLDW